MAFLWEGSMAKIGLLEKIYNWTETVILDKLVAQESPGLVFKWLFKMPILQYKLGLGWMIGKYILLLTTTGRKSGKLRYTPLEYIYDKENDRYRIAAGWGGNTDWYRNIKANPCVHVQVGRRVFDAMAEIASDKEVGEYMNMVSSRHPRMDKVWNRWSDIPVDGTLESYIHAAKFFPSVWLSPMMESNVSRRST
jgi:deazaflavin-dependent oxidoreductase (nitroreductase family)